MNEIGIDISKHRSKSIDEIEIESCDLVVTLCADEVCPLIRGSAKKMHWPFEDPASESDEDYKLEKFRLVRDQIGHRLRDLKRDLF